MSQTAKLSILTILISGCAFPQTTYTYTQTSRPYVRDVLSMTETETTSADNGNQFSLVSYQDQQAENESPQGTVQESSTILNHTPPLLPAIENETLLPPEEMLPSGVEQSNRPLSLTTIAQSIHGTFPLLEAAYQEIGIAEGKQIAAMGAFDTKLKAVSENGPLGFYETYRNSAGVSQPLYQGGEVFGGYRIGRGNFQPWYQERNTNDGGELKAGVRFPLLRNREIDARRAELWRADFDRQRAQPEIQAQLIPFVRDGSIAYWNWIAAGRKYEIGKNALELAVKRNDNLKRKVDVGDTDPPVLQDNLRAIAKREAKLIDLHRKLQQSAIKLSLFYRTSDGQPLIADRTQLTDFPEPQALDETKIAFDVNSALANRPELAALEALIQRVNVDLAEASNDTLPSIDAQLVGSQDLGAPTSKKRDKSELELELGLFVDVPLQRRKARGKIRVAQAKLVQLSAKRRFTEDKIWAEVQIASAALIAAYDRLSKARESRRLSDYMSEIELRKFELGDSDLLKVALREQYAIEAAEAEVDALLEYFTARADYDAALARDWPSVNVVE